VGPHHDTVVDEVALRLISAGVDGLLVRATLRYDPLDPLAVEATFQTGPEPVAWVLGRDVLSGGLHAPTGDGDVRVWPAALSGGEVNRVMIELRSAHGSATLAVDAADLDSFLLRTFQAVPQGTEADRLDLDGVVARLLT
jgi:hypothetical protein